MAQIKVLDLDNAGSLSELSYDDINIVRGGYAAALAASKNVYVAYAAYVSVLARTGRKWLARAASLSTPD